MDQDIASANELELERIKTQDHRDELKHLQASREHAREREDARAAEGIDHQHTIEAQNERLLAHHGAGDEALRADILLNLLPVYMKPTTATLDESMRATAEKQAKFLGYATDAVLAEWRKRHPLPSEQ